MVIGGLIILSIVWCIVRCCCCGLSCCCSCFQCLKCCGDCCGCCDPPGGRKHKHLDDPYTPDEHANRGYRTEPPMNPTNPLNAAAIPPVSSNVSSKPYTEPPQYAEFDMSKKETGGGEDSLPEMPSWEGAGSKKIMVEDAVEMDDLKKSPSVDQSSTTTAMHAPPGRNPYGQSQGNASGYFNGGAQPQDTYSPLDQGYGYNSAPSNGYGVDQSYGAMGAAAMGPGRRSPAVPQNGYGRQPAGQGYGQMGAQQDAYGTYDSMSRSGTPGAPQGYGMQRSNTGGSSMHDGYGMRRTNTGGSNAPMAPAMYGADPRMRQSPGPRQSPAPRQVAGPRRTPAPQAEYGYNQPQRHQSPAPQNDYGYGQPTRHTPAPQDDYGFNPPANSYTPAESFGRSYSPAPERQLTNQSPAPRPAVYAAPPAPARQFADEPPASPITNNSGFDFNSGYSRPQGATPSPTQEAYPGYKPYQP